MKNFFLSLKTTVWTLFVLVCLFFVGSYMMPAHREVFAPMNDDILFRWVNRIASGSLGTRGGSLPPSRDWRCSRSTRSSAASRRSGEVDAR